MKVRHVFEDQLYHISNYAVAGELLFLEEDDKYRFVETLRSYIEHVAEIIDYAIFEDQYRVVIRVKDKRAINAFFRKKVKDKGTAEFFIPPVSYIVSQQMANFQISYAKYFNCKYRRKGCVFRQRFDRQLIPNEEELGGILEGMKRFKRFNGQKKVWQQIIDVPEEDMYEDVILGSKEKGGGAVSDFLLNLNFDDLRSQFMHPPKIDLFPAFHRLIINRHRQKFRFGPNLN